MKDFVLKQKWCVNSQKMSYCALCEKKEEKKRWIKKIDTKNLKIKVYLLLALVKCHRLYILLLRRVKLMKIQFQSLSL